MCDYAALIAPTRASVWLLTLLLTWLLTFESPYVRTVADMIAAGLLRRNCLSPQGEFFAAAAVVAGTGLPVAQRPGCGHGVAFFGYFFGETKK